MKDKIKIILIIVITSFCVYKIVNWMLKPTYALSKTKKQSDEQLIAVTINGEARGQIKIGKYNFCK